MFTNRLITAAIGICLLVTVLLSDKTVLSFAVFISIIILLYELYRALGITKKKLLFTLGMIPPFFVFFVGMINIPLSLCVYIFMLFVSLIIFHKDIKLADVAVVFFLSLFVTTFLWHIALLRTLDDKGKYLIWAVFVGACMSDTCAYFAGRFFGRHKLAPTVSPKKTIEGSVGGVFGSVLGFLIYGFVLSRFFGLQINIIPLVILGVLSSVAAQIGDLSASIIKRECSIKDFGNVLPGHGGYLDRFDSILFTAPLVYYFVIFFPIF